MTATPSTTTANGASGQTIAVTGATGFVGRHVCRALVAAGYTVRALVRDTAKAREVLPVRSGRVELIAGDIFDAASLDSLCAKAHAVVNLVGIIREGRRGQSFERMHVKATHAVVDAAERSKVARFIQISAIGASPSSKAEYQRSKFRGEQAVRASTLNWTILRPGMILGDGSEFVKMALEWAKGEAAPWLFMPYFTRVEFDTRVPLGAVSFIDPTVQPVAVEDVAAAVVACLSLPKSVGEIYHIVGPERVSWPDMLRRIRDQYVQGGGNEPWGIPGVVASVAASAADIFGMRYVLPFDAGMATMGSQDSIGEPIKVREHLGLTPRAALAPAAELSHA